MAIAELHTASPVVGKVGRRAAHGDAHIDAGLARAEIAKPRDQPAHRECRADADGERGRAGRAGDLRRERGDADRTAASARAGRRDRRRSASTGWRARSKNITPSRSSRSRTSRLIAAGDTPSSVAASEKLPVRAAASKAFSPLSDGSLRMRAPEKLRVSPR